ncbi:hypothetical protein [Chitinilyticum piscinae]|uniref:Uncharacterized protein n=1 Tax=Chitinilyticum piscinae TaxID=2866724 RepID=A0A8J7K284_9NEIS|nr:hypothetical protein [Chitinilyticum piscinae]MBE9610211.1 hypothetical protein [Chitinilyticum piscinae]
MSKSRRKQAQGSDLPGGHREGRLSVQCMTPLQQLLDQYSVLVLIVGLVLFLPALIFVMIDGGSYLLGGGSLLSLQGAAVLLLIPLAWLLVGIYGYRHSPPELALRFDHTGLRLESGESWRWDALTMRVELQMMAGFGHAQTRNLADAIQAVLYLDAPGKPTLRMLSFPDRTGWGDDSDPGVHFRTELGRLLGYLPAAASAPVYPAHVWRKGAVFYPMQEQGGLFFWLLLVGLMTAVPAALQLRDAVWLFLFGVICLLYAAGLAIAYLDRVVVSAAGIRSLRHGSLRWQQIESVELETVAVMGWAERRTHEIGRQPRDIPEESYVQTPLPAAFILFQGRSAPARRYVWSHWPGGGRRASRFALLCETCRSHASP